MVVEGDNTMEDHRLVELLDLYAESLFHGADYGDTLVEEHRSTSPLIAGLVKLVRALARVFAPVSPSDQFVQDLRADLMREHERRLRASTRWERIRERAIEASAVVGAVFSVVALVALLVRVIGSIIMLVMLISRRRRAEGVA